MPTLYLQALIKPNSNSIALTDKDIEQQLKELSDWELATKNDIKQIVRSYSFKNFTSAMDFANQVTELAEQENHHPQICVEWGKVSIAWWTHTLSGVHLNDFIMASRCDKTYQDSSPTLK